LVNRKGPGGDQPTEPGPLRPKAEADPVETPLINQPHGS
jgi:hypothetical protein